MIHTVHIEDIRLNAVVKTRLRENSTFVLIACESLSNAILSYGACVMFVILVIGKNFIDERSCFYANAIGIVAYGYSSLILPLIALDRLLALLFPLWHSRIAKIMSVGFSALSLSYGLIIVYLCSSAVLTSNSRRSKDGFQREFPTQARKWPKGNFESPAVVVGRTIFVGMPKP
ncbi:serpentine type 7TM GPCR chemoreceptor srsx domain-containing protein [Ditylenchus destructor]|uniref:Serpentine type 7TM GPCR chemoreceptor srsx domain-containing protein n=1 Tax=Ditylenchus destructor TaxID=166010 RepID=A0AAD4MRX7_9BILA|nr:serpentine type 7TM GPCR chemoreceptor srsx domain-containing protein [Ditylenchus destructor]